jgi:hypothetical protein
MKYSAMYTNRIDDHSVVRYGGCPDKAAEAGLHLKCVGCPHPIDGACPYVVHPKQRKFPCYFKQAIADKIPMPEIPKPAVQHSYPGPSGANGFGRAIAAAITEHLTQTDQMSYPDAAIIKRGKGRPKKEQPVYEPRNQ